MLTKRELSLKLGWEQEILQRIKVSIIIDDSIYQKDVRTQIGIPITVMIIHSPLSNH
jgi:hypothetical protein